MDVCGDFMLRALARGDLRLMASDAFGTRLRKCVSTGSKDAAANVALG